MARGSFTRDRPLQESPSGLIQLGSAPSRPRSELRSALSGCQPSTGSAPDPSACSQGQPLPWRPFPGGGLALPRGPAVKGPPSWQRSACTQTSIPKPWPRVPSPRLSTQDPLPARPSRSLGSFRPSVPPAGPVPESVGSPVGPPLHSSAPHPGSRAGSHIRRRCRSCSAMTSSPRRRPRPRPKPARAARGGASPTAGGHASQPPSG